ncbi:MAG: hypothetical protein M3279_08250 [Actinomycetota bacterium]|nr:hypothetical protein [Actinomycetota bacterium]
MDRRRLIVLAALAAVAATTEAAAREIVTSHLGGERDHIVVVARDGSRRRIASDLVAWTPVWSPDHARVAYHGARTYDAGFEEVTVVARSGRRERRITGFGWSFPSWSPNGRWITASCSRPGPCERREGLYRIDVDRPRRKVRVRHTAGASQSSWAPGGSRIVFVDDRQGRGELFVKRFGRPRLRRLTNSDVDEAAPDWGPGGRWIVYSKPRTPSEPHDLWMVSADGDRQRRLTRTRASETNPAWSASGRRILFSTRRGLFTVRRDGGARRKVEGSRGRDCCADW